MPTSRVAFLKLAEGQFYTGTLRRPVTPLIKQVDIASILCVIACSINNFIVETEVWKFPWHKWGIERYRAKETEQA